MAADDRPVLAAGQNRLDESELTHAAGQRLELVLADSARVGGVWAKLVDLDRADSNGTGRRR
jgi:hypothetical protein